MASEGTFGPSDAALSLLRDYRVWRDERQGIDGADSGKKAPPSDEDLRDMLKRVQEQAAAQSAFKCIQQCRFAEPRMAKHPLYRPLVLDAVSSGAVLMDFGCCMGTDLRKLILDGADPGVLMGVDVEGLFVDLGLDVLYEDRSLLPPHMFTVTDLLRMDLPEEEEVLLPQHLRSRIEQADGGWGLSLVYAGSVLHLFDEQGARRVAATMHRLLSLGNTATAGGQKRPRVKAFLGRTSGTRAAQPLVWDGAGVGRRPGLRFLHTADSLRDVLHGCGFVNVEVWTGDGEIVVSDEEVPRPDRAFFDFVAYYPTDGGPPLRRR